MDTTKPGPPGSRILFPLAVLEVKLSGIEKSPEWLDAIIDSDYVVSAYKFSKFMHGMTSQIAVTDWLGTASLSTASCRALPPWFTRPIAHLPGTSLKHWYLNPVDIEVSKLDGEQIVCHLVCVSYGLVV